MSCPPTDRPAQDKPMPPSLRGAYQPHSLPARLPDLRHTPRHHPRHAPYPPPSLRPSLPSSLDEEDIGSSDSSDTTSDYSSPESDASRDELDDDDDDAPSQGFGFSAATWSSTNGAGQPPPMGRGRERPRVIYSDTHYEKYVMEERHSSRYYPGTHHTASSSSYTRAYTTPTAHGRRSSLSPGRASSYRRPVSPEPLYREYREYRDSRHHRDRPSRTSRSSQTSPVRIEPIHAAAPRPFVRALTPSRYRRPPADDKQRPKYQYESRVPPPPPSLSAPLTLRPPPDAKPRPLASNAHYESRAALDDGEDEIDDDGPPPRPQRATLPGGSSTSTFALSGGPSAPANNNGTTSTTTTFHVTTPRAISASLAAAQNAASQPASAVLQAESEKAEAEKMRIPSFKRGGKTRYQCLYCSKDFSRKNDAYRHMSRKHNDNATEFICVCGRVLSRGDALTRHMRTCRESKEKGTLAVALPGSTFVQGAPAKLPKKAAKKRRGSEVAPPPPGAVDMDIDGEEELDDASMEEED